MPKIKKNEKRNYAAIHAALLGLVIISAREYSRWTYDTLWRAQAIAAGMEEKPYVYRALVPWLASMLIWLGIRADVAFMLLIIVSAIGLLYGIKYLLAAFRRS